MSILLVRKQAQRSEETCSRYKVRNYYFKCYLDMVSLFKLQTSVHFRSTKLCIWYIVHCCLQSIALFIFLQNDYFSWVEYFLIHIFIISLFMSIFCPFLYIWRNFFPNLPLISFFIIFTSPFSFHCRFLFQYCIFIFSNSFISTSSIFISTFMVSPYDFPVLRLRKGHLTFY